MSTLTRPAVTDSVPVADRNPGRVRRMANRVSMLVAVVIGYLFVSGSSAFAQAATDPTGGLFSTVQTSLTGTVIPAAAALIVVAIIFALAVKFVSKAAKK